MNFKNRFHVPLPLDQAWVLMLDVPRIMPCLPGAKLQEVLGENTYRGSVTVKLGPIKLGFDGTAELVRADTQNHIAYLRGAGLDPKGRGSANADFNFALTSSASGGTDVEVNTELTLAGAVAQYGRGSGMIAEVASQILGQFEKNLARMISGESSDSTQEAQVLVAQTLTHSSASIGKTAVTSSVMASQSVSSAEAQAILFQAQAVLSQVQAIQSQLQVTLLKAQGHRAKSTDDTSGELNMLSIGIKAVWSQLCYSVRRIFGRKE